MAYKASDFIDAIPGSGGIITTIARRVGCDWATAKKYITEYATVRQAYENEKQAELDFAERNILKAVHDGDIPTSRWYLSTVGKDRGYTERQESDVNMVTDVVIRWPEQESDDA